jgi:hypothetical protein
MTFTKKFALESNVFKILRKLSHFATIAINVFKLNDSIGKGREIIKNVGT